MLMQIYCQIHATRLQIKLLLPFSAKIPINDDARLRYFCNLRQIGTSAMLSVVSY